MQKVKFPLLAAAALATALSVTTAKAEDITIGMAGPITGDLAEFGAQLVRGAEKAVADLNKNGGVMGKQVKLEKGDDQCDPKQAPIVANDLVAKGVVFVAGHFCSGSSIPASSVYAEEGILQITRPRPIRSSLTKRQAISRSAPAAVTISRAPSPVPGLPNTSRARTSRSFTTSLSTARVSPT
jgi:branched-chain amino acid transport system substrate-binding protein